MTLKKVNIISTIIALFLIILMVFLRHEEGELFTLLSSLLGGTALFTLLYYLFTTEKIKHNGFTSNRHNLFHAVAISLLVIGAITTEPDGFMQEAVRIVLAIEIFYLIFSWAFGKWKNIETLKNEKAKAELSLLKEQINPHFFFNTLNTLYALIKKDANAAQEYVLKLSDLMRFTIYDSGKESVLLKDEIDYLVNYIDLQTARYHREIDVNFVKSIKNPDTKVAPLLFIILLENAFKHGVEHTTEDAFIHVELLEEDDKLSFTVKNNFDAFQASENMGIGLQNLKSRLNLLYQDTHNLICNTEENIYSATLEILKR